MHALVTNAEDGLLATITCRVMPGVGSQAITHLSKIELDIQLAAMLQTYNEIPNIMDLNKSMVRMLLWCDAETGRASVEI
jgi:hypothetical protein